MKQSALLKSIGPGLLMAGAAVGVSHLVQASRAGAEYGFTLLGLVVLACLLKYPFLEFGPRYAAATGESMLAGYRRLGNWALGIFTLITISTMWIILASVTVVTAGLAGVVFGLDLSVNALSAGVLTGCVLILAVGHYRGLDLLMKLIMAGLAVSTLAAVAVALGGLPESGLAGPGDNFQRLWTGAGLAFTLALLGWMPIPLDVAAWHSVWTLERARQTGHAPTVAHAVFDFRVGFIGATVLAAAFLVLGAVVMHGTGEVFPASAVGFAARLVDLYAITLGEWARPVIAIAALTTMFSTTLAVADAYPRVLRVLIEITGSEDPALVNPRQSRYLASLLLTAVGALVIIGFFGERFTVLIDFTTTVSFLTAPILGWMNLKLLTSRHTPPEHRPGPGLIYLSWAGLAFLILFVASWLGWRVFG